MQLLQTIDRDAENLSRRLQNRAVLTTNLLELSSGLLFFRHFFLDESLVDQGHLSQILIRFGNFVYL